MKKITALLLSLTMVSALAACGTPPAASTPPASSKPAVSTPAPGASTPATGGYDALEPVELVGADSAGKGAAAQLFGELVASKLDSITGGKLTMAYYPNSELGGDADIIRQMKDNDVQIVVSQIAPLVSFVPEMAVFDLPMMFSKYDGDTIDQVLNGADSDFRAQVAAAYEKAGFHYLGMLQNATYRLTTANKDLQDLASFKNLQIRTMENKNHMTFWTAIGANPTPLAWPEVYFALQSGAIDAQENAADTCASANFNEVQKYLACTNHILYANQIAINKTAYDALDPAYQAALNQAVTEALAEMRPDLAELDASNKKSLTDKGMTLIEYDAAFYDEILNLPDVQKLYKDIDTQVGGLATVLQESLAG